jgi:phenylpyruvate tautomerase PptA (4-oxalocrotonate tautomerase family)
MDTSVKMTEEKKSELVLALSKIAAEGTGKPEMYVMAIISEAVVSMAGKTGPAAFLDIRSIGSINSRVNRKISQDVTLLLQSALGIPSDRVYLSFNDVDGANWGWNGSTFG